MHVAEVEQEISVLGESEAAIAAPRESVPTPSGVALLHSLWQERSLLALAAAVGAAIALLIAFVIPPRYESTTRIIPDTPATPAGLLSGGKIFGSGVASELLGYKAPGALFVSILQSRTMQDRLIDRFNLLRVYRKRYRKDARQQLTQNTVIDEDRKSGVVTLTVTDRDPHRAAELGCAYIEQLNVTAATLDTSSARKERVFLEARLQSANEELKQAELEFSGFSSRNLAIDIKEQARAMVSGAATVKGQLIAAESELNGLEELYAPENVRMRSAKARVSELQSQLHELGGDTGKEAETSGSYPTIRQLPILGLRYAELYRRVKTQETVYELLTQQYELAKVQEARNVPKVRVLDEADVPEKKSFPPRTVIVLLGTFLALLAAALWVKLQSDGTFTYYRALVGGFDTLTRERFTLKSVSNLVWRR